MGYLRNLLFFAAFAIVMVGCGGGNTTISANDGSTATSSSGGTGGTPTTTTPTDTGGTPTTTTTGTITLKWTAPTTWTDSSALSLGDIAGYRVYYGSSATDTPNFVNVNDGTATQYQITLPTGSYYFKVSTVTTTGVEGPMSAAVQTTI